MMLPRTRTAAVTLVSLCAILTTLLFDAPQLQASDFESARTAALGGAGHAGPLLNDAIYLNPSYTAFSPAYAISGNYDWASFQNGSYKYKIQNLSVVDGTPSDLFQAGLGYTHRDDGTFYHLGAGKQLIKNRLGVGVGGKVFSPSDGSGQTVYEGNLSATGIVTPWIQTSLLVDNIGETATSKEYGFYREVTVGTKFNLQKIMMLYVDPHFTPDLSSQKFGYNIGAEWPMFTDLFLRAGTFRNSVIPTLGNETRGRGFAFGFGLLAPRISIDWGLSRVLEPIIGTVQELGLTIYM